MNHNTTRTIAARTALRVLALMLVMAGVLIALPGCGGGDWPEEADAIATRPATPNCQQPGVCT